MVSALETKIRGLVAGFLSRPEEVKRRAEAYVKSERGRLSRARREFDGWEGRLADTERRRSALIDLAADGTITRNDLRTKLAELDREREACHEEIRVLRESREELEALETLPELAEQYARDLPYLLNLRRVVRNYESIAAEPHLRTHSAPTSLRRTRYDTCQIKKSRGWSGRRRRSGRRDTGPCTRT